MKSLVVKQLLAFFRKEFYHMIRDKKTLFMLIGVPIVQIIIFGFALTNEINNADILVVDYSKDAATQRIIGKIQASTYFNVEQGSLSHDELETTFRKGKIKLAVIFPANFNYDLLHLHKAQIQIIADASDPNTATTLTNYISAIISNYQAQLETTIAMPLTIEPTVRMLYNPELKGAPNFVPGVIALVLFLLCVTMTSISVVKEKEMGTMEVLLVSPIKPWLIIVAKAVPYLILSLINLILILLLSVFLLDMPIEGSIILLFAESTLFIICALALGMLISNTAKSQQGAFLSAQTNMMLPAMLLTGFMFPVENMPIVLRLLSYLVPSKWYYTIMKAVMLKGVGLSSIWLETLVLAGMTFILILINIKIFKVRL
jgi:ABC-2 type transport system permease protein